jgi:hypothetical protein
LYYISAEDSQKRYLSKPRNSNKTFLFYTTNNSNVGDYKMKKTLIGLLFAGLVSTSAFAGQYFEGKIDQLVVRNNGEVFASLIKTSGQNTGFIKVEATGDYLKAILASLMTAKSLDATIYLYQGNSGLWTKIKY